MRYEHRFIAFLVALVLFGFVAAGVTLVAAREMASDDMRIGPGSAKFPPQGAYTPSPDPGGKR